MKNRFEFLTKQPPYMMPTVILVFSLLFVLFSVSVDSLRQRLFAMLKINTLTNYVEEKVQSIFTDILALKNI